MFLSKNFLLFLPISIIFMFIFSFSVESKTLNNIKKFQLNDPNNGITLVKCKQNNWVKKKACQAKEAAEKKARQAREKAEAAKRRAEEEARKRAENRSAFLLLVDVILMVFWQERSVELVIHIYYIAVFRHDSPTLFFHHEPYSWIG